MKTGQGGGRRQVPRLTRGLDLGQYPRNRIKLPVYSIVISLNSVIPSFELLGPVVAKLPWQSGDLERVEGRCRERAEGRIGRKKKERPQFPFQAIVAFRQVRSGDLSPGRWPARSLLFFPSFLFFFGFFYLFPQISLPLFLMPISGSWCLRNLKKLDRWMETVSAVPQMARSGSSFECLTLTVCDGSPPSRRIRSFF